MTDLKMEINGELMPIDSLRREKGVIIPYSDKDYGNIKDHFSGFIAYRRKMNEWVNDTDIIQDLPFSMETRTWKNKQVTLSLILKEIQDSFKKRSLSILIVGSGNGWLANQLSEKGHSVLGIDVLYYEFDGLETIKHYQNSFHHMLLHPHDLRLISGSFDLIIFENNLPYIKAVFDTLEDAKSRLSKGGKLWCTAINMVVDVDLKKRQIQEQIEYFKREWDHKINTYDTKMYLDQYDLEKLKNLGFSVRPRTGFRNLVNRVLSRKVVTFDAVYQSP